MREHSSESLEDSACGVSSNCIGRLGSVLIEEIGLDAKSHDDIPALLIGLQTIYTNDATRTELFCLLDEHITLARGLLTDSKSRSAACRKRAPTPSSPPDAASKTCVGPTSSIGGLVVAQPSEQKNGTHPAVCCCLRLRQSGFMFQSDTRWQRAVSTRLLFGVNLSLFPLTENAMTSACSA